MNHKTIFIAMLLIFSGILSVHWDFIQRVFGIELDLPSQDRVSLSGDRELLVSAMINAGVIDPDTKIVIHVSHVCNLLIDGKVFHVADTRELLPAMNSPRGQNKVTILNNKLVPVQIIDRSPRAHLLRCDKNVLLFGGEFTLKASTEDIKTNAIKFTNGGRTMIPHDIDFSKLQPGLGGF